MRKMSKNLVELMFTYEDSDEFRLYCPFCGALVLNAEGLYHCPHTAFIVHPYERVGEAREELLEKELEEELEEEGILEEELEEDVENDEEYRFGEDLYEKMDVSPF